MVVTGKMLRDFPAHVRLYDLLFDSGEDLRSLSFIERSIRLETWHAADPPLLTDLSALVPFETFGDLTNLWSAARAEGIEGLMLKRRHTVVHKFRLVHDGIRARGWWGGRAQTKVHTGARPSGQRVKSIARRYQSPYLAGRIKGEWFKWKRAALTVDCVLMYGQRGSGKRSSFYSDYTFGVWTGDTPGVGGAADAGEGRRLVPVGKAYSGYSDVELRELDRWIRNHTTETFGPVRAVEAGLVLEVAFDAVRRSARHKSGVAMRFPRIHRIRWDKPAAEADTLDAVTALIGHG